MKKVILFVLISILGLMFLTSCKTEDNLSDTLAKSSVQMA
jgi:hypothetical protein